MDDIINILHDEDSSFHLIFRWLKNTAKQSTSLNVVRQLLNYSLTSLTFLVPILVFLLSIFENPSVCNSSTISSVDQ
jgi:hypothetical protein